ncbi:MAG: helix-turn-helix transcriptional regulator [Lachnospiraceae bacterium]|jgi:transcriptional regulator with XRE-family HTH domain|nr:helix-turn-helix transcriptional regulator [Lachnospiraceae bacterium]
MENENYGTLVKNLRIKNGLTQNQVAESLGVTPGYISNVENNRTAMSLRMLTYYARLVGCSLDSLVGELEPEYAETALDRSLYEAIIKLDTDQKEKLLKTIEIWNS